MTRLSAIGIAMAATLAACGSDSTAPDPNAISLPTTAVAWPVTSDTTPLFPTPGVSNAKFVNHSTKAGAIRGSATLTVSCSFAIDGLVNDAPRTTVTLELTSGVFPSQLPLVIGTWLPSGPTAVPAMVWQVPTLKPWVAGLTTESTLLFLDAVKSKSSVRWSWGASAAPAIAEAVFDLRQLSSATSTISTRCRR